MSSKRLIRHFDLPLAAIMSVAMFAIAYTSDASAGVLVFQDNFDDGNSDGWVFKGNDSSQWGVVGGKLNSSIGSDDDYDGASGAGVAYIDGITTPGHFSLEADVSVIQSGFGPDFGHVGFIWGFDGATYTSAPPSTASLSYFRTHQDAVTTWSAPFAGEKILSIGNPINPTNGVEYKLAIEVNNPAKSMQIRFNDALIGSITGADFDTYVQHSGGNIGLLNWGEEVTYDNVKLFDLGSAAAVPEPTSVAIWSLIGLAATVRRRRKS